MTYALYIASVMGAIALYLMMPRRGFTPVKIGAFLGAATLGALWLMLAPVIADLGEQGSPFIFHYLFSAIAIAAGVRVITHPKPVYSALWFVLLVLASAGLFLTLEAEFMAIAMVIIYAGAILVTYLFVIMLASQGSDAETEDEAAAPEYDRVARDPGAACAVGFVLLAVLLTVFFQTDEMQPNPMARAATDQELIEGVGDEPGVLSGRTGNEILERIEDPEAREKMADTVVSETHVYNVERVGLDLFLAHPLGIELAGVILLISLVGAVVIARKRVELDHPQRTDPPIS